MMNNFQELIASDKPVLVDFFATWCGPCKMMHPILEDISKQVGDRAKVVKIDVDQAEDLAMQYRIQSVPTLMIFKSRARCCGASPACTMLPPWCSCSRNTCSKHPAPCGARVFFLF